MAALSGLRPHPARPAGCRVTFRPTVTYFATREFRHTVPGGPNVVTEGGRDVWVAASAPPVEQWLNQYAAERGYPSVPWPPVFLLALDRRGGVS